MSRIIIPLLVVLCIIGAVVNYVAWPSLDQNIAKLTHSSGQEQIDRKKTKELLNQGRPEEAHAIIQEYAEALNDHTEEGREWLNLLIRASEATSNVAQLLILNDYYPKAFESHEKAALLIANQFLSTNRIHDYQSLRDSWNGSETRPEVWFVLDSDKLLLEGKRNEAIEFLNSRSFHGKSDSTRLIRLALLYVFEQPKVAWEYLSQAYSRDPENPDIRSYRAKLLETFGKDSLALSEYQAAAEADPKNPYLKDQLAEFYIRSQQYPEALAIWKEQIKNSSLDSVILKSLFWSRVATPISIDWHSIKASNTKLEPFIDYLLALENGSFWDPVAFERIPEAKTYLQTQQATVWLRILQNLKMGKEKDAYDLLTYNPFSTVSWNSPLENALKQILHFRITSRFTETTGQKKEIHPLFTQLENAFSQGITDDLHALITGPEAFAAAFLAAGWEEAGLSLHTMSSIPMNYPEWVSVKITQAISNIQGDLQALKFANLQPPTPELTLLMSELLIAAGKNDPALEKLSKLQTEDSAVGFRAAKLVSGLYMELGQYDEAKTAILLQPRLAHHIFGKETLARIALLEGNQEEADALYVSMEGTSPEAQSYLARKAFFQKDWKRARELTERLLRQYPNNTLLRENLKKIAEEEKSLRARM